MSRQKGVKNSTKNVVAPELVTPEQEINDNLPVDTPDIELNSIEQPLIEETPEINTIVTTTEENLTEATTEPLEQTKAEEVKTMTILVSGTDAAVVVRNILYAASLGAVITPREMPRFTFLPYTLKMDIPDEEYPNYLSGEFIKTQEDGKAYNEVTISTGDALQFVKDIIDLGAKGAILPLRQYVRTNLPYQAKLLVREPVVSSPTLHLKANRVVYTKEELEDFSLNQLKIVGSWHSLTGRGKSNLVREILISQKG